MQHDECCWPRLLAHREYLVAADASAQLSHSLQPRTVTVGVPACKPFALCSYCVCPHLRPSSQLSVLAQEAICTVGELFLAAHKGYQRQALLPARARDEGMSAGEMLFDKLPGADSAPNEADAWQVSYQ